MSKVEIKYIFDSLEDSDALRTHQYIDDILSSWRSSHELVRTLIKHSDPSDETREALERIKEELIVEGYD